MTEADLQDLATSLADALKGRSFGTTTVLDAGSEVDRDDEGDLAIFIALILSDPPGDTWPYAEVLELRRSTIDLAEKLGARTSLYLRLAPATEQAQEDDEAVLFPV